MSGVDAAVVFEKLGEEGQDEGEGYLEGRDQPCVVMLDLRWTYEVEEQ